MDATDLFGPGDVNQYGDVVQREENLRHARELLARIEARRRITRPPWMLTEHEREHGHRLGKGCCAVAQEVPETKRSIEREER